MDGDFIAQSNALGEIKFIIYNVSWYVLHEQACKIRAFL